jgi:hypothetical protein
MHSLIHADLVHASTPPAGGEARADPPPGSAPRRLAARVLARTARRLDREAARRAVA